MVSLPDNPNVGSNTFSLEHIFYVGTDQHVYELEEAMWDPVVYQTTDITATVGAPLAQTGNALTAFWWNTDVVTSTWLGEQVFYLSMDGHVQLLSFDYVANKWSNQDLTVATGAVPAALSSGMSGYTDLTEHTPLTQEVVYQGTDNHIYQLSEDTLLGIWMAQDLTLMASLPAAPAGTSLAGFTDPSGQNVIYEGTNQHIIQAHFSAATQLWSVQDLTAHTGNHLAASGVRLAWYVDESGAQHVVYEDTKQHVDNLSYNTTTKAWSNMDLTSTTGSAAAIVGSGLATGFEPLTGATTGNVHIAYVGTNGHIYVISYDELAFDNTGQGWSYVDASAASVIIPAQSGTALTGLFSGGTGNGSYFAYVTQEHTFNMMIGYAYGAVAGKWVVQLLVP